MSELTLEAGAEPRSSPCPDCGQATLSTAGFIYRDGLPYAIYHAALTAPSHPPMIDLAIGIGEWATEDASASASVFIRIWATDDEILFGFVDPSASVWSRARRLEHQLTAEVARSDPTVGHFMSVAELVAREDPTVRRRFS